MTLRSLSFSLLACAAGFLAGCSHSTDAQPGRFVHRQGDEIVVCGQWVHTGAPVVTWMDPGGYDAYRVERRFAPLDDSDWRHSTAEVKELKTPNRYGLRKAGLTPAQLEQVRGGGWPLALLQEKVDQLVLHFDACGTSRQCFKVLQDQRDLSVHFMLDLDGTIYQTPDLKERAWHATISNDRSVGIEIANIGAYDVNAPHDPLSDWYRKDASGRTRIVIPEAIGGMASLRSARFVPHPARDQPVVGMIQGQTLRMYDLTPRQYDSLIKLTATLCRVFPRIRCDYPRDAAGRLITHKLPSDQLAGYEGVLGHYHIQTDKTDPGPALDWDRVINGARALMAAYRPQ
jgi:N-acetylmuramoyl-L-alanine amidase